MLVLDNCALKLEAGNDVYNMVIEKWTASLRAMENILRGITQGVSSGSIFIAISAWHLYPDMSVMGVADLVKQQDPYVESLGILTVGLDDTFMGEHSPGVFWSVPLAHLRFYGKPTRSTGMLGRDNARLTMDEFGFVMLGCVFSTWKGFAKTANLGVQFALRVLWILRSPERESFQNRKDLSRMRDITSKASWIGNILDAAERFNDLKDPIQIQTARQIVSLGNRKSVFLCPTDEHPSPLFGLSKFSTLFSLFKGPENCIALLRKLGKYLNLSNDEFVIRYFVDRGGVRSCEYTTIFPVGKASPGRLPCHDEDSEVSSEGSHIRWLSSTDNLELRRQAIVRLGEKPLSIVATPRARDFRDENDYASVSKKMSRK
jgi:hypothetical protein